MPNHVDWQPASTQDPDRPLVIFIRLKQGAELWFLGTLRLGFRTLQDSAGHEPDKHQQGFWIIGYRINADRSPVQNRRKVHRFFTTSQIADLKRYWE